MKEKVKEFLNTINNQELNVSEATQLFKNMFANELDITTEKTDEAYFKETKIIYSIKNSNGISLNVTKGLGDIFGDTHSHNGADIILQSTYSKYPDKYGVYSTPIFNEGDCVIKNIQTIEEITDKLFDIDLSKDNLIRKSTDISLSSLSKEVLDNNKDITDYIILNTYSKLKQEAELKHDEQVEYDNISPYGGLDIEIDDVEKLLFKKIEKLEKQPVLFTKMIQLFNSEYDYLKEMYNKSERALYFIENKERYRQYFSLEDEGMCLDYHLSKIYHDRDLEKKKYSEKLNEVYKLNEEAKKKEDTLNRKIEKLQSQKFTLLERILGKKKEVNETIKQYIEEKNEITYKDPSQCTDLSYKYDDEIEKAMERTDQIKSEMAALNLKYPFENFTIWVEAYDPYSNENGAYESLQRLIAEKGNYQKEHQRFAELIHVAENIEDEFKTFLMGLKENSINIEENEQEADLIR